MKNQAQESDKKGEMPQNLDSVMDPLLKSRK